MAGNDSEIVVPYVLVDMENGKSKALFGVPAELAPMMIEHPVMCRGACFYLEIDRQLSVQHADEPGAPSSDRQNDAVFLCTVFESPDPDGTADAISKRLAVRLGDPVPMRASQLIGM